MLMMVTCREAARLIAESQDRILSLKERWVLRLHLMMCRLCTIYVRQLDVLRRMMKRLRDRSAAPEDDCGTILPPEARARITEALRKRR